MIVTDVDEPAGRAHAGRIGATFHRLDTASADDWSALVAGLDRIDGLVNNAATFRPEPMLDTDEATYRRIVEVNQLGVFLGMRAVAPVMAGGGGGSIVNISSIGGIRGVPAFAYASTKWAVRGMTRTAARELAPLGIRVNAVLPGVVDTEMLRDTPPDRLDALAQATPMGRVGQPAEIADPVVFLLSDESRYINRHRPRRRRWHHRMTRSTRAGGIAQRARVNPISARSRGRRRPR